MNRFRSIILLTICIGLVYGMACFLMQPEPLQEVAHPLTLAPQVTSVHTAHLPAISSVRTGDIPLSSLVIPKVETPSVIASSSAITATSSATAHSVSGGVAHYVAPVVPITSNSSQTVMLTYAYNSAVGAHSASSVSSVLSQSALSQSMSPRKVGPGAGGSIESTWQSWLDEYGSTDLSGLEDWWYNKYGGAGYPEDAFRDFYDWANPTPLSDGVEMFLCLLLLYGAVLYNRVRTNRPKYE